MTRKLTNAEYEKWQGLEPGDTGQAILPAQTVKDQGAWLPEGTDPVWGDVRHHRERIDQLKGWVKHWYARAAVAEAKLARLEDLCREADGRLDEPRLWTSEIRETLR